jgi:hypothetical protein
VTGYSWKTSQFGLTIDTVTEFELVLPSGQVKTVTEEDEDLWFGLKVCPNQGYDGRVASLQVLFSPKGGLNNYVSWPNA